MSDSLKELFTKFYSWIDDTHFCDLETNEVYEVPLMEEKNNE